MPGQTLTIGAYFKSLNILHYALIAGQVLFALIAFGVQPSFGPEHDESLRSVMIYMVPVGVAAGIIAAGAIYKKDVTAIRDMNGLTSKLEAYRATVIKRDALLEAPSIFAIICFLITGEVIFLALSGLIIAVFFYVRPSKEKMIKDLALSTDEAMKINDDNSVISG